MGRAARLARKRRTWYVALGMACALAVAASVAMTAPTHSRAAVVQATRLYACVQADGLVALGSSGRPLIRQYAMVCDSQSQQVTWRVSGVSTPSVTASTVPPVTAGGSTSTSVPVTSPNPGSNPPPAGGYFTLSAPGTAFPSDATCAGEVHRSIWEPRPDNAKANGTVPPPFLTATNPDWDAIWNANYRTRITGNFTGTTDEIIQWAACKWGWPDDLVRGEAVDESDWHQSDTGDTSSNSADCAPIGYSTPCPSSFGALQIKWYYNVSHSLTGNAFPWSRDATAYSIDYALSQLRGCYDGHSTYLGNTKGNLAGCVGAWFSGGWDPSGGAYWTRVSGFTNARPWLKSGF